MDGWIGRISKPWRIIQTVTKIQVTIDLDITCLPSSTCLLSCVSVCEISGFLVASVLFSRNVLFLGWMASNFIGPCWLYIIARGFQNPRNRHTACNRILAPPLAAWNFLHRQPRPAAHRPGTESHVKSPEFRHCY